MFHLQAAAGLTKRTQKAVSNPSELPASPAGLPTATVLVAAPKTTQARPITHQPAPGKEAPMAAKAASSATSFKAARDHTPRRDAEGEPHAEQTTPSKPCLEWKEVFEAYPRLRNLPLTDQVAKQLASVCRFAILLKAPQISSLQSVTCFLTKPNLRSGSKLANVECCMACLQELL